MCDKSLDDSYLGVTMYDSLLESIHDDVLQEFSFVPIKKLGSRVLGRVRRVVGGGAARVGSGVNKLKGSVVPPIGRANVAANAIAGNSVDTVAKAFGGRPVGAVLSNLLR